MSTQATPNLSQFIRLGINTNVLKSYKPFGDLSDKFRKHVIFDSKPVEFKKGDVVFGKQRDPAKALYLLKGKLSFKSGMLSKKVLEAGSDVCFFNLDSQIPDGIEAVALEDGHALLVDRQMLDTALAWTQTANIEESTSAGAVPVAVVADVSEEEEGDWMSNLLAFPLFFSLPPANISRAFSQFERIDVNKGERIIQEGAEGDYFFVVISGKAAVVFDGNADKKPILLDTGSYFGEDALLSDKPRSASVDMLTTGVLGRMGRDSFRELLVDSLVKFVSQEEVGMKLIKAGKQCVLVDVRSKEEFDHSPSFNARNIPYSELRAVIPSLDAACTYYISHEGGKRSELAAHLFSQANLKAFVISG